ncbi:MAG: putative rane protein, partial [Nocardioides sp.]|nr:putative rane protein [Nocardioides sp.]
MSSATTATTRSATPRTVPPPRHLASYLALPRPGDTVKWLILPLGFAVGSVREWPGTDAALRAVVVWLALELLIYQARYQWNDIRGFEADQRHPDGDRGRLPGPLSRRTSRVAWSAGTAVAKVVAAVALCGLLDLRTGWVVAGLVVAVFALASVYEALRATSTGRTGQVPAPLAPGVVAIWVVIGAGYALRAVTGMGLAVDLGTPDALLPLAVVACWAFGISWITSRWAIEATAFASRAADGGLRWSATAEQAREHQLALVRWLPDGVPAAVQELRHWRAVQQSARWSAPWNLTGVVAGA